MVRFIQTSDWQIGMKGGGLGDAAPVVREARIKSIQNILEAAQKHEVDFVLLCGDIFEHNMVNQEDVRAVVVAFNQYPDIPIYLLPGNHDILGADCIYNREIFQRISHLTIIRSSETVSLNSGTLHPCPVFSKFITQDLTGVIPIVHEADGIHIGVAHGSLIGKTAVSDWEDITLPIDPSCVDKTGIDYLALGHWHGYRAYEDAKGTIRIAYSGTHEQTKYDEDGAGKCLLIQIAGKGEAPQIEPIQTGQLKWESRDFEMRDASSIDELKQYFESIGDIDMVRLVLRGELPLECKEELDNMLEYQGTLHKNFRVKIEFLDIIAPVQLDEQANLGDPTLNQTAQELNQQLASETDTERKKIIAEALTSLLKFGKDIQV